MDKFFLQPFLHFLRIRGLRCTIREYSRILRLLNLKDDWDLEKFRHVLKKVLVKNKDHALIFTQCFEDFFITGLPRDKDLKKSIENNIHIPSLLYEVKEYSRETEKSRLLSLFRHKYQKKPDTGSRYISFPRIIEKLSTFFCFLLAFIILDIAFIIFLFARLPGPHVTLSPSDLSFTPGKEELHITLTNTGYYKADIEELFLDPEPENGTFVLSGEDTHRDPAIGLFSLAYNESKQYTLSFYGDFDGTYDVSLVVKSNSKESPQEFPINIKQPKEPSTQMAGETEKPYRIYKKVPIITDYTKEEIDYPKTWILWTAGAAALLLISAGYILYLYFRKVKTPSFDMNGPTHFSVKHVGGSVDPCLDKQALDHIADSVGYFISEQESRKIDEIVSIEQTCKKGFPVIHYQHKKQVRRVIVLEDRFARARDWNPLATELVEGLKQRGVPVTHGFFKGIPDEFVLSDRNRYRIEDIEDTKNGTLLFIFSDSKGVYHKTNAFILERLSRWDFAAWIELRDRKFWDESTARVMEYGIQVYPGTKQGIFDVLDSFTTEQGSLSAAGTTGDLPTDTRIKGYHNLSLYIEDLLGDSLDWAGECSLVQPLPFGLAHGLRAHHHRNLDPSRIERLFMLPGTTINSEGIRFSPKVHAILKDFFYQRRDEDERKEVLLFILAEMDRQKPPPGPGTKTLELVEWKWQREKIHFELDPDKALSEIKTLIRYPIKNTIALELEKTRTEIHKNPRFPGAKRTEKKLHTAISSMKGPQLKLRHYITLGTGIVAFLVFTILGIRNFLSYTPLAEIEFRTVDNTTSILAHTWLYCRSISDNILFSEYEPTLPLTLPRVNEDCYLNTFSPGKNSDFYLFVAEPARWTIEIGNQPDVRKEREEWDAKRKIRTIYCPDTVGNDQHTWPSWRERLTNVVAGIETTKIPVSTTIPLETIKQTETKISIGIQVLFNETEPEGFKEIQNLLLKTSSVDVIYSLVTTDGEVNSQMTTLREKLLEDYGPFLPDSQFVVWSDNMDWRLPDAWEYPVTALLITIQEDYKEFVNILRHGQSGIITIPNIDSTRSLLLFPVGGPLALPNITITTITAGGKSLPAAGDSYTVTSPRVFITGIIVEQVYGIDSYEIKLNDVVLVSDSPPPGTDRAEIMFSRELAVYRQNNRLTITAWNKQGVETEKTLFFTLADYGILTIDAQTSGNLYLDEALLTTVPPGSTTTQNDVPVGEYKATMHYPDGYTESIPILVEKEKTTHVQFKYIPFPRPEMVKVEGGSFRMGSESGDEDEKPVHTVILDTFYISKYEVTQEEYLEFCTTTNIHFPEWLEEGSEYNINTETENYYRDFAGPGKDKHPVVGISWYNAVEYCNWLSEKEGLTSFYSGIGNSVTCNFDANGYRLPTEAEWEYAARGGGKSEGYTYSGSNIVDEVAWYDDNSGNVTHPVGEKKPNELALFDMSGNVYEWCWDWYGQYTTENGNNPRGPASGSFRVLRGGCWFYDARYVRSASRNDGGPGRRGWFYGFRLARG